MTTSNSTDYNLTTNQIIEEAFDICGVGSEGEAISADQYARARRSLNLMVKTWGASGHLWLKTETSVTLVDGQANYALATLLGSKPLRVEEARRRVTSSGIDTPLMELSRTGYFEQPNKTVEAIPTAFYYDPQTTTGTLYLWPTPSASVASDMTLRLTYIRKIEDFDGSGDDADFPQEWLEVLAYGLASALALKYGVRRDLRAEINGRAAMLRATMESWDAEPASLFLQPEGRWC